MGSKKKAKKNADFKKVKLKVGKKLKKTTTTDTTIKAKKVVLISQLNEKSDTTEKPLSFRGLSLEELCRQLGHFNKTVRRDALLGTKQLLNSRPDLIETHLRTLIPSIARLVADCGHDPALNGQLRSLLRVICSVSSHAMSAHFTLLVAHLLHALTHSEAGVRSFSLSIIALLLTKYPDLCCNSVDLFNTFVKFLNSSRKPSWNSPRFLETIELFVKAFSMDRSVQKIHCEEAKLTFSSEQFSPSVSLLRMFADTNPFDFPVIGSSASRTVSPLELPESVLNVCEGCAPVIGFGAFLYPS
ncbi:hypothetical protein OESDEN_10704 [Oesophagostomum dentatum]|uniref:Pre-rRNA-processing protein Ipi1 N-terminal domain-containing protein n=1 Tax=Oesophagostomum dentatum TaxID=61180 RepID=A0A0B1SWW6_OESDE|nr:hypothetical protein OESDEN_10704 [Oesophagostomum dentatum]